jgi:glycerol-3-phosphate dehydrogenase
MGYTPHVLVIGGGSTGTGVARDLAMRGLEVTLVEKGTLTDGTTGRMHGLLHSGARYADTDPRSARQCARENDVLRDIAGHCIEETGGLFVKLPGDDGAYLEEKQAACEDCDIPVQRLDGAEARRREPTLTEDAEAALAVPDAAVDPFRLTVANAKAALEHGARISTHTRVIDVLREGDTVGGVRVRRDPPGEVGHSAANVQEIEADYVVNATGPWVDDIGAKARLDVDVTRSKGAMVVQEFGDVGTVVNRCRPATDADIVVPHGEMAILGTTHEPVEDPEDFPEEGREVDLLLDELATVVPGVADARTFRSYWGVRPLFDPDGTGDREPTAPEGGEPDSTTGSRDFRIVDHEERDGVWGISTVYGGKFTTYRLMAEAVADHVCEKFGIDRPCRTADVPLPGSEDAAVLENAMDQFGVDSPVAKRSADRLGSRTAEVLDTGNDPNPVVCSCEAVTRAEIQDAIEDETGEMPDLNEIRIRTRASMGTCQGGRCAHRIAGELYPTYSEIEVRRGLNDLLEERWKGQRHALWGEQLAQAMRNYALHAATMNRDAALQESVEAVAFPRFDPGKEWVEQQTDDADGGDGGGEADGGGGPVPTGVNEAGTTPDGRKIPTGLEDQTVEADDPEANQPKEGDPEANQPKEGDPEANHPEEGDPEANHPEEGDSKEEPVDEGAEDGDAGANR